MSSATGRASQSIGAVLLRAPAREIDAEQLMYELRSLLNSLRECGATRVDAASTCVSDDAQALRLAYLWVDDVASLSGTRLVQFVVRCRELTGFAAGALEVMRLEPLACIPGADRDGEPGAHYVVHTDVEHGAEAELESWYGSEHLPALAGVPGTVLARRFLNLDAGPRYYACYELLTAAVLGCPEWLAVRATAWSNRVRPLFRNTRRHMFGPLRTVRI